MCVLQTHIIYFNKHDTEFTEIAGTETHFSLMNKIAISIYSEVMELLNLHSYVN